MAESEGDRELAAFYKKQIEGLKRQVGFLLGKAAPPPPARIPSPEREAPKDKELPSVPGSTPPEKLTKKQARSSMLLDLESHWVSKPRTTVPWPPIDARFNGDVIEAAAGYQIELPSQEHAKWEQPHLEEEYRAISFYCTHMHNTPHKHYVGESEEAGPVIMTAEETENPKTRVLVRLKRGDVRVMVPRKVRYNLCIILLTFDNVLNRMYARRRLKRCRSYWGSSLRSSATQR